MRPTLAWLAVPVALAATASAQPSWSASPAPSNLTPGWLAFDARTGHVVSAATETWEHEGAAWALRSLPTQASSPADLVYDPGRGIVALGIKFDTSSQRNELAVSTYLGTGWQPWPATNVPVGTRLNGFYDAIRRRLIVVTTAGGAPVTWSYDGASWQRHLGAAPSPRATLAIAFDESRGRAVLFGGLAGGQLLGDTWEWDGTTWLELTPGVSPSPRVASDLVFDAARARVMLFGGRGATALNDLWEWDGRDWRPVPTTIRPPAGQEFDLVYDPVRENLVLVSFDFVLGTRTTWALTNTTQAIVTEFGMSCASFMNPLPWERPWIGDDWSVGIGGPWRAPVLLVGGSKTSWAGLPLPTSLSVLGVPSCFLNVSPNVVLPSVLGPRARFVAAVPVPGAPALVGKEVHVQFAALDANSELSLSDSLTGTIGAR
ncbi:MAG: hypothetical protein AAF628_13855 [Planctomycetota bacterium]